MINGSELCCHKRLYIFYECKHKEILLVFCLHSQCVDGSSYSIVLAVYGIANFEKRTRGVEDRSVLFILDRCIS